VPVKKWRPGEKPPLGWIELPGEETGRISASPEEKENDVFVEKKQAVTGERKTMKGLIRKGEQRRSPERKPNSPVSFFKNKTQLPFSKREKKKARSVLWKDGLTGMKKNSLQFPRGSRGGQEGEGKELPSEGLHYSTCTSIQGAARSCKKGPRARRRGVCPCRPDRGGFEGIALHLPKGGEKGDRQKGTIPDFSRKSVPEFSR